MIVWSFSSFFIDHNRGKTHSLFLVFQSRRIVWRVFSLWSGEKCDDNEEQTKKLIDLLLLFHQHLSFSIRIKESDRCFLFHDWQLDPLKRRWRKINAFFPRIFVSLLKKLCVKYSRENRLRMFNPKRRVQLTSFIDRNRIFS